MNRLWVDNMTTRASYKMLLYHWGSLVKLPGFQTLEMKTTFLPPPRDGYKTKGNSRKSKGAAKIEVKATKRKGIKQNLYCSKPRRTWSEVLFQFYFTSFLLTLVFQYMEWQNSPIKYTSPCFWSPRDGTSKPLCWSALPFIYIMNRITKYLTWLINNLNSQF